MNVRVMLDNSRVHRASITTTKPHLRFHVYTCLRGKHKGKDDAYFK